MRKAVRIHELLNTCVLLSQKAGAQVRKAQMSGEIQTMQKGICSIDVVTEADLRIQKTIQYNLSQLYPNSTIICEEDESHIPTSIQPSIMPDEVSKLRSKQQIFTPGLLQRSFNLRRFQYQRYLNDLIKVNHEFSKASDVKRGLSQDSFNNEIDESELTFWVDPLDGSSGFAEGHTQHLTCIIGVSVQNRPLLGVIHKPFSNDQFQSDGRTYIGLPESGLFIVYNKGENLATQSSSLYIPPFVRDSLMQTKNFRPRICGSHNKNQVQMNNILNYLRPESVERVAGSGNKFVYMVDNRSNYYINLVPGFKNWDMCGSEALVQARFGIVTDAYKNPISYDVNKSFTLRDGIVAAKNKNVYMTCLKRIEEGTKMSLEMNQQLILQEADELKRIRKLELELSKPQMLDSF